MPAVWANGGMVKLAIQSAPKGGLISILEQAVFVKAALGMESGIESAPFLPPVSF
jgi:hypothetical protein